MNVTLDTNSIIDLEEERDAAPYVKTLISMHEDQRINLRVVAISASERKPGGKYAPNFAEFEKKIGAVGLGHVEVLAPIAYSDITYFDWCLAGSDQMVALEREVHRILFPEIGFTYDEFCSEYGLDSNSGEIDKRWRNPKCDVLALWSHIHHGGGIFVTTDNNMHKETKKTALIALGAGDILRPKDAVARLTKGGNTA